MSLGKITFIARWLSALLIVLFVTFGVGFLTLKQSGIVENRAVVWFSIAMVISVALHFLLIRFNEARQIHSAFVKSDNENVWNSVAKFRLIVSLIKSAGLGFIFLCLDVALAVLYAQQYLGGRLHVTNPAIAYVSGYLLYWFI